MEKDVNAKLEQWKVLRDHADEIIKRTLGTNFPCPYGYQSPSKQSSRESEMEVGRALWAFARSDLMIKTIQINHKNKNPEPK